MAWLGNWQYRHKITIDATKIVSNLTHFPVRVHLSSYSGSGGDNVTDIFDEIGGNKYKIAFTKSDGETQLYGEIENWDSVNKVADIWVSSPELVLDSTTDTEIYIYFDNSQPDNTDYIGLIGSPAGQAVWDSNFVLVNHMKDDDASHVKDSTFYGNNGSKRGENEPIETDGKVGKAQDFDGSNDYIIIPHSDSLVSMTDKISIVIFLKITQGTINRHILSKSQLSPPTGYYVYLGGGSPGLALYINNQLREQYAATAINDGKFHQWAGIYDGSTIKIYIDELLDVTQAGVSGNISQTATLINFLIGAPPFGSGYFSGLIDEVRISNIARSAAWIRATYNSVNDTLIKDYAPKETSIYNPSYYLSLSSTLGSYGEQLDSSSFSLSANLEYGRWRKDTTHSQIWIKEETHNEIYKS